MATTPRTTRSRSDPSTSLSSTIVCAAAQGVHVVISFVLGVRGSIQSNVEFCSDATLLFPTAHHLGLYNVDRKTMEFFHPTRGIRSVHSMCLSTNKELLVVCEQSGPRFSRNNISDQLGVTPNQISIYKMVTRARLKTLPSQSHAPILSVAFSADNKCLVTLEDAPNLPDCVLEVGHLQACGPCAVSIARHAHPNFAVQPQLCDRLGPHGAAILDTHDGNGLADEQPRATDPRARTLCRPRVGPAVPRDHFGSRDAPYLPRRRRRRRACALDQAERTPSHISSRQSPND